MRRKLPPKPDKRDARPELNPEHEAIGAALAQRVEARRQARQRAKLDKEREAERLRQRDWETRGILALTRKLAVPLREKFVRRLVDHPTAWLPPPGRHARHAQAFHRHVLVFLHLGHTATEAERLARARVGPAPRGKPAKSAAYAAVVRLASLFPRSAWNADTRRVILRLARLVLPPGALASGDGAARDVKDWIAGLSDEQLEQFRGDLYIGVTSCEVADELAAKLPPNAPWVFHPGVADDSLWSPIEADAAQRLGRGVRSLLERARDAREPGGK